MDFQSLTRRELQALCKKNKIPANMTNVAMADALEALQNVEGLEELLNSSKSQNPQSPEKPEIGSPEIPRTVCRTSTRRRPIKAAEEPESSQTLTRTHRGTRRITEEVNQDKSEAVQTPAVPSSRKRAPAASARQKTTNAEQSSVQRVYSTRRSTRLSDKLGRTPMEVEFSKVMTKDLDGVEEENKGSELQAISEDSSKITDDSEVISDQKSVQSDNDSKAETEEITEESAKPDNSDFIEVSDEKDEARDEENTGESSMLITDSEVVSDQKPVQNVHDSRAEVQENNEESAKPDNSDCLEVLEVKDDEALDEQQNTEAEMQKNSEVECEKMDELNDLTESPKIPVHLNDESIVEKGIDVSSVTMSVIENLNEDIEMENEHQGMGSELGLDFSAPPQASVDDSSCDSERTEFSLTDFADEVLCENPISIDSEINVTSEGEPDEDDDDDDDDDQGDSEEFDMDLLNQEETNLGLDLTAPPQACSDDSSCGSEKAELSLSDWMHSIGSDSSVVVDQSEAQVELESANQEIMDFEDISLPSSDYDPKPETGEPNSEEKADETNKSVELITAEENAASVDESLSFLDSFPTPVKLMSPHRLKSTTAISGRTPLSPLAASPLLNQAALPTLSTPTRKSSTKNPSAVAQKKTHISDNKENLDNNSGRKTVIKPEPGKKKNSRDTAEDIKNLSLRQLRKMFKELQIKENANKNSEDANDVKEVIKARPALQTLPENCMAKVETGTEN